MDGRHKWIAAKLAEAYGIENIVQVEKTINTVRDKLDRFFDVEGPNRVVFYHEPVVVKEENGEWVRKSSTPEIRLAEGEFGTLKVSNKVVFFVRITTKGVSDKTMDTDVAFGEVLPNALESFRSLLGEIFVPMLREQAAWGKNSSEDTQDFLQSAVKFSSTLNEAVHSLQGGIELALPNAKYVDAIELKPQAFSKAAADTDCLSHMEGILDGWNSQVDRLLTNDGWTDSDDAGPDTELEHWRSRMAKLNSITEQLKTKEAKVLLGVCLAARSKAHRAWKALDVRLTDASNEAKDNVKYLMTLEKSLEPMYHGSPQNVVDSLPSLLNNIRMMQSIARYYNTPDRMTTLFCKVTNQMIHNCKDHILGGGKIWDQDKGDLVKRLDAALRLHAEYKDQYRAASRDRLQSSLQSSTSGLNGTAGAPGSPQRGAPRTGLELDDLKIFNKFDLFVKRVNKLREMFVTIQQFSAVAANTHIEGLETMIKDFSQICEDMKRKPYDLLDYTNSAFDRDFLEFNVQIHELETTLQGFINSSFENITSTDNALNLLKMFQSILQRDSLKADLDDKYMLIFQNYGLDLNEVQGIYEKHKHQPPKVRNAPPVAGSILWSRQLLTRIEEPMRRFSQNKSILQLRESKKIIKTYNRVARALIEFETLWHQAWIKSIDTAKAGLQATLIVRHPETGRLLVNFDREILQLIKEAKYLQRMGLSVPESAKMVLLQEDKFKYYYNKLTYIIREYDRICRSILQVAKPLLAPHVEEMEKKIQPGMYILTWTSMNIDGYLNRVTQGLSNLEELARKVNDILENRVEGNIRAIARSSMISLPTDTTITFEEFVTGQSKHIKQQTELLKIRNVEINRALEDAESLLTGSGPEDLAVNADDVSTFKQFYAGMMYNALLGCTKRSLQTVKKRLGARGGNSWLQLDKPLFEINIELAMPTIRTQPSLEEIQTAINTTAKRVLKSTVEIKAWGPQFKADSTFFDVLAADKEVVKSVLLLTGSIESLKQDVTEYLGSFSRFDKLWKMDMQAEYESFMKTSPALEDVEQKLREYMDMEQDIGVMPPMHVIGCLQMDTKPLKYSLKSEAASWKAQFAKNLQKKGSEDLKAFTLYMKETSIKLMHKVEDLEDVRQLMAVLREVREKEASIDEVINPIEDMYSLLMRYEVRVPKEETDLVSDLRYSWKKLKKLSMDVSDTLSRLQVGFKRDLISQVKVFVQDVVQFRTEWEKSGPMVPGLSPMEAYERLRKNQQLFDMRKLKWTRYTQGEELFGLPLTSYPELERTEKEVQLLDRLYSLYMEVITTIQGYGGKLWVDVKEQMVTMSEQVATFQAQASRLPKALKEWPAYADLKKVIDDFQQLLPTLQSLAHPSMRPRHWQEIMRLTGRQLNLSEDVLKLQDLLEGGAILKHQEEVDDVTNGAVKEEQIEKKLVTIGDDWTDLTLSFQDYRKRGPVVLKPSDTAEVIEKLEDSQMTLASMATNRYSAAFREDVSSWQNKLSTVSEVIEQWLVVQSMWMYMEAVFSGGDIVKQLPQEAKRFQNIDKNYMKIVANAIETRNIVGVCCGNELMKSLLPHLMEQLELCQKSLSAYLETKRAEFPRFYFVSDPTLLEILSLGSDPQAVTPHFQSGLFDSLTQVEFDKANKTQILAMFSQQGEKVTMYNPVEASGNVEVWLQRLVDGMQLTVKQIIRQAYRTVNEQALDQFIFGIPAQIALLGIQFQWTADCQAGLANCKTDKNVMSKVFRKTDALLKEMVTLTTRQDLNRIQRINLETCITVHVHQRDCTEDLVKKKIRDPSDFEWLKQCRFYWRDDRDTVIISICDVDFEYSFEYLGVKERLVITPLTDICYITLTLGMYLGGAPAGPAGTGKTETTKDLGNTLGKYVVVFNCSDQMDYKGMGKIYKGLAQSGLWGCFDEFNRINLDVLSVCAQQVYCVLSAIRERKSSFIFTDGSLVPLDIRVGFFITMNPGYAGRQELPENLKALFRGVTMMVPNRQIIMKVKLAACGYQENEILSKKFFVLYGLCEQQLSKQAHYDFGLRNILSVLRTAGTSKRTNPDRSETYLMMRTLRDMNMSKFVAEDVPLFLSLIEDLFPGLKAERAQFPDIQAALEKTALARGLQCHPNWLNKCIQLYETYLVRHGIMVIGPAGAGKTAIVESLAGALTELGTKHVIWKMNPKAITAPQMFGMLDAATGDWTDGVFAVLWRRAAKAKNQNTWINLDGPVDAIWIENLNTVLDDNKVLTLANGDRIQMTMAMKAMFEAENLNNASPATVSRAGIIFVSDTELGWKPVVMSWLQNSMRNQEREILRALFDKYIDPLLDHIRIHCRPVMFNQAVCTVAQLCTLMDGCLKASMAANEILSESHYERLFVYCMCWSLGALLSPKDRESFDKEVRKQCENLPMKMAEGETLFDYMVDDTSTEWVSWKNLVPVWKYPMGVEKPEFASLVIPTMDSVRLEKILQLCHSVNRPTLLVGGAGTAKTTTIQQFLRSFDPEVMFTKGITFSYLTTPRIFQSSVEGLIEKRQGRTFGPPGGKKMILFIDDLSMPKINEWGDQITNEIVRQLLELAGFYSLEKPIGDMKYVVDANYVAAMIAPGGGKNDIPNRLKRQFTCVNVPLPSKAAIEGIFGTLMAGRFEPSSFDVSVCELAGKLVPMTMQLWQTVQLKILPTPAKFHYMFNIRELSKVFQGIILASRDRFKKGATVDHAGKVSTSGAYLLALWYHECHRVFCDKLVTYDDKDTVDTMMKDIMKHNVTDDVLKQCQEPVFFVDFLREPVVDEDSGEIMDGRPSFYEACLSIENLRGKVEDFQRKFNEDSKVVKLELVLFKDALQHLMRITRILCMARGSALLVGVGGSGKQSLTRLAAFISGAYTFQITITKTYNVTNLFEDLKGMYKIAGFKGQKVCFIFTDAEVKDEGFLEYINQLLMTGEVAGLFPKDEIDMLVNDCRPAMKAALPGVPDTYENLYNFFLNRVRENLHVCLCFSPVGGKFARRAMQFPGLINGCTIDWFMPWPEDALVAVSSRFIGDFEMFCSDDTKRHLQGMMAHVHVFVTSACREYFEKFRRNVYVTPKSYLSFINGYKDLYSRKLDYVRGLASSINVGLQKMLEAKKDVNIMKKSLEGKNKELEAASKEAEVLLKNISLNTAVAEKEKNKVAVIVASVTKKADEISAVKADAERDLAAAKPALDAAVTALGSIKPGDIQALKALKNPPDVIKRIFDAVLMLRYLPVEQVKWQEIKGFQVICGTYTESVKMMSDSNFLGALLNFPKEQINDETVELLKPYFDAPDFNFDSAKKASGNVAGLCSWAQAMCTYHDVAKVVDPKIIALKEAEAELRIANKEKDHAESELAEVQAKLDEMQAQFDAAMKQKQALEEDAMATQKKMDAATALITALAGEEIRWTEQSRQFDDMIDRLTGDCAMASAFISYLGPFNKEFRELLVSRDFYQDLVRLKVPVTKDMNVAKFLVEDSEVGEWTMEGLPTDELSIQNGIMVTRATRYPILVDPQGQGRAWLMKREDANGLKVTTLTDKMFRNHLEDCLSFGKPLLIENIEEDLDPLLDPVLEKRIIRKGRSAMIQLADKEVDYSDGFRLFCTTRLPNPHYSPELSAKTTIVDFTVTLEGLEDQLLGKLILKERHELEEQRQKLLEEVNNYKRKIRELEDDLLLRLSSSQGNLLDDTELIDVLAKTKKTAQEVNERLQNASETNKKITEACEEFRPVSHRAALIYFLISEFSAVNCMYQTSLNQFAELYDLAIDRSEKANMPSKRIHNIIEHMTYSIYVYIARGLFERHKLIFALMLANKILVSAGKILSADVDIFLKGGGALDINAVRKKPKEWISDAIWLNSIALSGAQGLSDIVESVYRNEALWRQWYDQEAPEQNKIPEFDASLTRFQRLLVIRSFREDRTLLAAMDYIADTLGRRFVESVPLNLEKAWEESNPRTPLICLLSAGADPTKLIEDLSKKKKKKVLGVSMGQGQEIIARKYMAAAVVEGHWVLLQNTHLGLSYLSEVETFLLKTEEMHPEFRLWITAEPHPQFPIGLLQMGIKITNEAPVGMKAGLRASYSWVSQDMLDQVNRPEWRQLLFIMCYMHSIVQERRKFGPIGWNIPYEFNQSDLSACTQFLQNHLTEMETKKANAPTWDTVRFMIAQIQYGGRITDDFDHVLMDTYAEKFFHQGALTPKYTLFKDDRTGYAYQVPDGNEIEQYRKAIEDLPPTEGPEIFGLHSNANLTFQTLQVQQAIELIADTQPKTRSSGGGLSREEVVDKTCEELLSKLPAPFDLEEFKERLKKLPGGPTQPLTIHLKQEVDRLNIVIKMTAQTLNQLRQAIAGTIALNASLLEALDALYNARIPPTWLGKSWEAATLGNWFNGLLQRHEQLQKWVYQGRPKAFWLTGFFNPQGFLTAMKQEVSRKHAADKWALDDVVMSSEVTHPPKEFETLKDTPAEGVYIYGLFLDGCAWSGKENRLVDSEPKKLFCPLPVLWVTGVLQKDKRSDGIFKCPTYRVKKRTGLNFITVFDLRMEEADPSKWVTRGVGLLATID